MCTYTPRDPYPTDWPARAEEVRAQAQWRCEPTRRKKPAGIFVGSMSLRTDGSTMAPSLVLA